MQIALLSTDLLRFSSRKRRGVSPHRIEEFRKLIEEGVELPPIHVCALGDGSYVVRDGRHRIQAHLEAGIGFIYARIENSIDRFKKWLRHYLFRQPIRLAFFIRGLKGKYSLGCILHSSVSVPCRRHGHVQ